MERYIDADLIPYVESENGVLDDFAYRYDINEIPTADVVPKSEVEALEREIGRLKKSMLPSYYSACSEEEAIKIGKQYGRTDAAREIFEEIESYTDELLQDAVRCCDEYKSPAAKLFVALCEGKIQAFGDMKRVFAELKKKYQEGDS